MVDLVIDYTKNGMEAAVKCDPRDIKIQTLSAHTHAHTGKQHKPYSKMLACVVSGW